MMTAKNGGGALVALLLLAGLARSADAGSAKGAAKSVEPQLVCMVNDKVFGQTQLPVVVEGKTYYGCCAGCVGRLNNDREVRFAKDPFSGREVDKAEAVILEGEGGTALYFESQATARRYQAAAARKRAVSKS